MKGNKYNWKLPDTEILKSLYWDKRMSTAAIAKEFNVTKNAVQLKLKRHDIPLRSMTEGQSLAANYITLSKYMLNFIDGLLLGDGCMFSTERGLSASYRHSDKNALYIKYLECLLSDMGIECRCSCKKGASCLNSKYYRNFIEIRKRWYPEGIKKTPPDIELKPITLLNWYIGDGSYHPPGNHGGGEQITIAMQYDETGRELLHIKLHKLGIANSNYKNCIYICAAGRLEFFNYMARAEVSIPECYKYKFPERYYHGIK